MRSSALYLLALVCVVPAAHADTYMHPGAGNTTPYTIYYDMDDEATLLQINDAGDTQLYTAYDAFVTYRQGQAISTSYASESTPPPFASDNGSSCAAPALPSGFSGSKGVCNGAYEVYLESHDVNNTTQYDVRAIFPGSSAIGDIVAQNSFIDLIVLSSTGDFTIVDGREQNTFTGILTPEPSTFALLGTGLFGALGVIRRRISC